MIPEALRNPHHGRPLAQQAFDVGGHAAHVRSMRRLFMALSL
jgi:hypothetical protein